MSLRPSNRPVSLAVLLFFFIVLPLGLVEGWYGRADYSGDAIPYLDMARAVQASDWKLAFNPLWGLGYSLLIAALKPLFASTAYGEWNAVHALNLLIFTAAFAGFLFLLRTIARTFAAARGSELSSESESRLTVAGTALFLSGELCMDNVSRVGPDLLVSTLILVSLALLLQLIADPRARTAALLGATLGFGYVTKTIFLPLSLVILLTAAFSLYRKYRRATFVVISIIAASIFALPYVTGLSWALGRFTLGESGTLNYAWHVNRLSLMHWQGGPTQFGKPIHPTTQLLADPPIYGFSEPFPVTYPPFFNPPYFYEGYRHFFSAKLQLRAIAANLLHLVQALRGISMAYAVVLCLVLLLVFTKQRSQFLRSILAYWPILLPAFVGVALYLQVHLEGRYLPSFLLVLAAVPLTLFFSQPQAWPAQMSPLVIAALVAGCVGTLWSVNRTAFADARHHVRYSDNQQWVLARFLDAHGLQPGNAVAIIGGPATHCTWAYVDHLRIVSELSADVYAGPDAGTKMFWGATPAAQQKMLDLFAKAGAKLVVAPVAQSLTPGWIAVPGTNVAVHDLY